MGGNETLGAAGAGQALQGQGEWRGRRRMARPKESGEAEGELERIDSRWCVRAFVTFL